MVKAPISFYGIQEANGFELLRMLRREFSLVSRPEALQHREACLKFTVKKADRHLLLDVLREVSVEVESFHSMYSSMIFELQKVISIFCIFSTAALRKSSRICAVALRCHHCGHRLWEAVNSYYVRMRMSGVLDKVARGCTSQACSSWIRCGVPQLWSQRPLRQGVSKPSEVHPLRQVRACCQGLLDERSIEEAEWSTQNGKTKGNCQASCRSQRERKRWPRQS